MTNSTSVITRETNGTATPPDNTPGTVTPAMILDPPDMTSPPIDDTTVISPDAQPVDHHY